MQQFWGIRVIPPHKCAVSPEPTPFHIGAMPGTIMICGSMAHFAAMQALAARLTARGISAVAPADERGLTGGDPVAIKRALSARYFRLIRRRTVAAILVANLPRRGRKNYIGANTFAEIAVAVSAGKTIYLLHGFYPPLADELRAWGAIPLHGRLGRLRIP